MTTTNENIEVEIPGSFIKDKDVDFDGEIYAAMGASLPIGGFLVRAPSMGVFSLLETFESPFIASPDGCDVFEFWRALYINEHRSACVQEAMEWAYPNKGALFDPEDTDTWQAFDWSVFNWGGNLELDDLTKAYEHTHAWFNLAFEGFDMIPGKGSTNSSYWFGADSIGSLSAALSISVNEVLWDVSMCAIGHQLAALCKQNGNDHIARKKDVVDFKLQSELAKERVRNGEMHPWQLDAPEQWPLSSTQAKYNPKLIDAWQALVKEKKDVKR